MTTFPDEPNCRGDPTTGTCHCPPGTEKSIGALRRRMCSLLYPADASRSWHVHGRPCELREAVAVLWLGLGRRVEFGFVGPEAWGVWAYVPGDSQPRVVPPGELAASVAEAIGWASTASGPVAPRGESP